jgi:hypothetical protein
MGVVWAVNSDRDAASGMDDAGVALLNYYNFVRQDTESAPKALRALVKVLAEKGDTSSTFVSQFFTSIADRDRDITVSEVHAHFKTRYTDEDLKMVFGAGSDYDKGRVAGIEFMAKAGLGRAPKVLLNGVPLDEQGLTPDKFEETLINGIMRATPRLQRAIIAEELTDAHAVGTWVMERADVMPRLNARILGAHVDGGVGGAAGVSTTHGKVLDLTDTHTYTPKSVADYRLLTETAMNAYMVQTMKYLRRTADEHIHTVTLWLVTDVETPRGRAFVYEAIKQLVVASVASVHTQSRNTPTMFASV